MGKINKSLVFWVACLIFSTYIYISYVTFSVKVGTKYDLFKEEGNYSSTYVTGRNNSISDEDKQELLNALKLYNSSAFVYPRDGTPFIYIYRPSSEASRENNKFSFEGRLFTEKEFNDINSKNVVIVPSDTGLAYYSDEQQPLTYLESNYEAVGILDRSHPYFNQESKAIAPLSKIGSVHSGEWYFTSTEKDFLDIIRSILSKYSIQEVHFNTEEVNMLKYLLTISVQDKWGRTFLIASISALGFLLFATEIEIKGNRKKEFIKFSVGARKKSEYKFFLYRRLSEILIGWSLPAVLLLIFDTIGTGSNLLDFSYISLAANIFILIIILFILLVGSIMYFSLSFKRNGERL